MSPEEYEKFVKGVYKLDKVNDANKKVGGVKGGLDAPKTVPQQLTREGQVPVIGKMKDFKHTWKRIGRSI